MTNRHSLDPNRKPQDLRAAFKTGLRRFHKMVPFYLTNQRGDELILLPYLLTAFLVPGFQKPQRHLAARFQGGSVSWEEFYLELARRHRGKPLGREALQFLVDQQLVGIEARAHHLTVAPEATEARIRTIKKQLESRGKKFQDYLKRRGLSIEAFRKYIQLSLLNEALVRKELHFGPRDPITPAQFQVWRREKSRKHKVITAPGKLPFGISALIGAREFTLTELGKVMARNLVQRDRESILQQMVAAKILRIEADKHQIHITEKDLDKELERRKEEAASNPKYKKAKIGFLDILKAQGRTVEDLKKGSAFQAQILAVHLGQSLFPKEFLQKEWETHKELWMERLGPSRRLMKIDILGPPQRTIKEAIALAEKLRKAAKDPTSFRMLARQYSEDPRGKKLAGDFGFIHRKDEGLPPEILSKSFELAKGQVSEPIVIKGKASLLMVTAFKKAPPKDRMLKEIRAWLFRSWLRKKIKEAHVEFLSFQ